MIKLNPVLLALLLALPQSALAESASVKINDVNTQDDTSILIKKGHDANLRDFEVVSGAEEVAGEPALGFKAGYAAWKSACDSWKKEMKEMNKENQILALNCNSPSHSKQEDGQSIYKSMASYKLRVRIRTR